MKRYAQRYRLRIPGKKWIFRHHPLLLHAYVSAHIAHQTFQIDDPLILHAIERHTLGHPAMSPLDKILYLADISSYDRNFPEAQRIRRLARKNLPLALREAMQAKLNYVHSQNKELHPLSARLWNRLRRS